MKKISLGAFALAATLLSAVAFAGDLYTVPTNRVPEPGTLALLAMGIAGIAAARISRRK